MKNLLFCLLSVFLLLLLGCNDAQVSDQAKDGGSSIDLNQFEVLDHKNIQFSYYLPDEFPPFANYLRRMSPLGKEAVQELGISGDSVLGAGKVQMTENGNWGLITASLHSYGWWEFYLSIYDPIQEIMISKNHPLATCEGDAGELSFSDTWLIDFDNDGDLDIVEQSAVIYEEEEGEVAEVHKSPSTYLKNENGTLTKVDKVEAVFPEMELRAIQRLQGKPVSSIESKSTERQEIGFKPITAFTSVTTSFGKKVGVNEKQSSWTKAQKELFDVALSCWRKTTDYQFSEPIREMFLNEGIDACRKDFCSQISFEANLRDNRGTTSGVERMYENWFEYFDAGILVQISNTQECEVPRVQPENFHEAEKWRSQLAQCLDFVFEGGEALYLFLETPNIHENSYSNIQVRIYDKVTNNDNAKLFAAPVLYFTDEDGHWRLTMRRYQ